MTGEMGLLQMWWTLVLEFIVSELPQYVNGYYYYYYEWCHGRGYKQLSFTRQNVQFVCTKTFKIKTVPFSPFADTGIV